MPAPAFISSGALKQWLSPQWFPNRALWGGASLVLAAYGLTYLPGPVEFLAWTGILGVSLWGMRRLWQAATQTDPESVGRSLTPEQVQQAIAQTKIQIEQLRSEAQMVNSVACHTAELAEINQSLTRQTLDVQIVGTRAVGKTALRQALAAQQGGVAQQQWWFADETDLAVASTNETDVVLLVVQGDLTQAEWHTLQQLQASHQRLLLVLNKQDQYLPTQAELVLAQLRQRVQGIVAAQDVVAIATCPQPIKVQRHQVDGSHQETWETPPPQLQPLLERMQTVATQEVKQLVLQRAYHQNCLLQTKIQGELNQLRRDRALPLIERYQWIAAGTAFANPLPSLDMVATAAITGKMIQELAGLYRISLSLDRATDIAGVFAKTLIQMGVVEAASQLLSAVLKGNAITYVAGGMLQGVGAAYFTRIAGLSLIELFEVQPTEASGWQFDPMALGQIVQRLFQQHQRLDVFKEMVQQAGSRFRPADPVVIASA